MPDLIDHAVFDDLLDYIGVDSARSVIEMFLGESRDYLAKIEAASADPKGRDIVRRSAHSLKSASGQLGAAALAATAEALERAAEQPAGILFPLIDDLQRSVGETEAAIVEALSRRG